MNRHRVRRWLASLSAGLLLVQTGAISGGVSAETTEKTVARFSTADMTTQELLYGSTFYTNWQTADGFPGNTAPGKGADLSGSAANGAHKKMVLKTTLTLTALDTSVDVNTCWKTIWLRLRSAKVDGQERESNMYTITPQSAAMADGVLEIAIPLADFQTGNIQWADVRQLNVACELVDAYRLKADGPSQQIRFTLADTRIVREFVEGEVDKDELQDLVKVAIAEEDFTPASVAAYTQAVEDGKAMLTDNTATQEQVDAAAAAIKQAKAALVSAKETYKGKLQELLEETITGEDLTDYERAKEAARPLLDKADATQKEVNDAVLAIVSAKLAHLSKPVPGDPYDTIATISGAGQAWSYLQGGKNFYTNWQRVDGITDTTPAQKGVDVSGSADNGTNPDVYLQMRVAFTALSEKADPATCWKQIGVRLRSSTVDGQLREAGFFYLTPDQVIDNEDGTYTVRLPVRVMTTDHIDWTDVKELNVLAEMNPAYCLTAEDGSTRSGDSEDIGFSLGGVRLVKKRVWKKGDVDHSGEVTATDALLALKAATGAATLEGGTLLAADVDGQEGVSVVDALMILQSAAGKISLPEPKEKKMVAFTFDDGPSENTAAFLDALKERGVHATFFVIGKQAEQYPQLVARMAAEGHEVGNHSYSHDGIHITGRDEMIEDYGKCSDLIEQYTGKRPTLMRAVGGSSVEAISDYVQEQGLRLCGWTGGGDDYNQTDKDVVVNFYMKDGRCTISDGDLILLHENHASSVAAALELIDKLLAEGYECVTVQELLDARADGGVPGTSYSRVIDLR